MACNEHSDTPCRLSPGLSQPLRCLCHHSRVSEALQSVPCKFLPSQFVLLSPFTFLTPRVFTD